MALIVTILIAYVVKLGRLDVLSKLWIGVGIALIVPLGIGAVLTWGPYGMSFQAQEILGGSLSLVAVGFVTWMVFWMGKTASTMKSTLHTRLDSALIGAGCGVVVLAMLSVGREGIETSLFVWATVATTALGGPGWGVFFLPRLSVGREGIECWLPFWAAVAGPGGTWEPPGGGLLGLLTDAVPGFLLCRAMVKIILGCLFTWSGAFFT